jgi:transposase
MRFLFHHRAPAAPGLARARARARLDLSQLPPAAQAVVEVALRSVDRINEELVPMRLELHRLVRAQPGCRALQAHYGVGHLTSLAIWADSATAAASRPPLMPSATPASTSPSTHPIASARGHLTRQGPGVLRWALFEAAVCAAPPASPTTTSPSEPASATHGQCSPSHAS